MTDSLAPLERLTARLGTPIDPASPDHARAEEALWSASIQAKAIAEHPEWTADTAPEAVVDLVLAAAQRIFKNPDRFINNQAGTFQAVLPQSDFATGGIFLAGELVVLRKHGPSPLRLLSVYRDDPDELGGPCDPSKYVADPTNLGLGDPLYGFSPDGPGW